MAKKQTANSCRVYRIRLEGRLESHWSDWFEGQRVSYEEGITVLEVEVEDQTHLHGILTRIRDLNLVLISLETIEREHK
jgi:hypothetical protein